MILILIVTVFAKGGMNQFVFTAEEARGVNVENLVVLGYVDLVHRWMDLDDLFKSSDFLNLVNLGSDMTMYVTHHFVSCNSRDLDVAVLAILEHFARFKNFTGKHDCHTAILINNCDLSCSVIRRAIKYAAGMGLYVTFCTSPTLDEGTAHKVDANLRDFYKLEKTNFRSLKDNASAMILELVDLVYLLLNELNLLCVNLVVVPESHFSELGSSLEKRFNEFISCFSIEMFDVGERIYYDNIEYNDKFAKGPTTYFLLMSVEDAIKYHDHVINEHFSLKKVPIILTNEINIRDTRYIYDSFSKLKHAIFFNIMDENQLSATYSKYKDDEIGLSQIHYYDGVVMSFNALIKNARAMLRPSEAIDVNVPSPKSFAELLFMRKTKKNKPKFISIIRYYFGNKTTLNKKITNQIVTLLKPLVPLDACGMHGYHCKNHMFRSDEVLVLTLGATSMTFVAFMGYLLYLAVRYATLQRNVIQWKISFYDDGRRPPRKTKSKSTSKSKSVQPSTTALYQVSSSAKRLLKSPDRNQDSRTSLTQPSEMDGKSSNTNRNAIIKRFKGSGNKKSAYEGRKSSSVDRQNPQNLAIYQEDEVYLTRYQAGGIWENIFKTSEDLELMKNINHENLLPFLGISMKHGTILMLAAKRGSLRDIIKDLCLNQVFNLGIMVSVLTDIAKGMDYLHDSDIGSHGNLRSSKCVLDNRWNCKITGYGLSSVRSQVKKKSVSYQNFLYYSPELLRTPIHYRSPSGTRKGDIYAFGIILQEVILMDQPFAHEIKNKNMEIPQILALVRSRLTPSPFRPSLGETCRKEWKMLARACWNEIPENRFSFPQIVTILRKLAGTENLTFVERLSQRLEQNVSNLGNMVTELTADVQKESEKANAFLSSLLPKVVAQDYILGKQYKPEIFPNVSILCTDIIGFTKISSMSTPIQTVQFLKNLYTRYDKIVTKRDAYKLETIGDAYIVISGCPERNGTVHASEVSEVALAMISLMSSLKIPHLPNEIIQIRAGIHSGPIIAGVVGLKVPRFCVFGKTYNMAEMMEGTSLANQIQISKVSVDLLPENRFNLKFRGKMFLPDSEPIDTYFLVGKL